MDATSYLAFACFNDSGNSEASKRLRHYLHAPLSSAFQSLVLWHLCVSHLYALAENQGYFAIFQHSFCAFLCWTLEFCECYTACTGESGERNHRE